MKLILSLLVIIAAPFANAAEYMCEWMVDAGAASLVFKEVNVNKVDVTIYSPAYSGSLELCYIAPTGTDPSLLQFSCGSEPNPVHFFTFNKQTNEISDLAVPARDNYIPDVANCREI